MYWSRLGKRRGVMRRGLKLLTLLAVVALVASACGSDNKTGGTTGGAKTKVGLVYDLAGRGDHSFNDSAYEGLKKAQKDFTNIQVQPDLW
jgi:basic membrane protein A and related proteins